MVYSSNQGPADIRAMLFSMTGLPANKIIVSTKRTGGAFGGKLSRSHPIACAVTVAAIKLGRPVRCQMVRTHDLEMWGKRQQFYAEYQIGADDTGKISALSSTFYMQGGHSYESNFGAMNMALQWSDNVYNIPNFSIDGKVCRTNTTSNTAMRGPGAFKSILHSELVIEYVARNLNLDINTVRTNNFYKNGDVTPYGETLENITLSTVWSSLLTSANYAQRKADVDAFNAANRWRKRGIHCTPVKYGIALPGNCACVLLNVCADDGTVEVSTTGVELGQGLNTKVAQAVIYGLKKSGLTGLSMDSIVVVANSTDKIANGAQTGGSATSESCVSAALIAAQTIVANLQPVIAANPSVKAWDQIIALANNTGVNISTIGYSNPQATPTTPAFTYYVFCAACSEVEIDVLTGEIQVLQVDIVYDGGISLNPDVDIGQIEGGFIQALGHHLTEEILHDTKTGQLVTNGTWNYHPPISADIPIKFNVTLLPNTPNTQAGNVLGSKATAEPPLMMANSVFLAAKDAIYSARADNGTTGWFQLDTPATPLRVQQACLVTPKNLNV